MEFKPLYYQDKLLMVNPLGDVGIVTLWSPVKTIYRRLLAMGIDLEPRTSRIAVLGTLYGNGIPELLRNLLYNPQICHLVMWGRDLSGSSVELSHFFAYGLEQMDYMGTSLHVIVGTKRQMDNGVTPADFAGQISLTDLNPYHRTAEAQVKLFFAQLPPKKRCAAERIHRPIPPVHVDWYPSEPLAHTVVQTQPLAAWRELIMRLVRFGQRTTLAKGARLELQNVKVVVQQPVEESPDQLAQHGFVLQKLQEYQQHILDPHPPIEQAYTYGNRLRGYFPGAAGPIDSLALVIAHFQTDPETRHGYVTLWDETRDPLPGTEGVPCLVALFFRQFAAKLTLTATFRTHNALDGWLRNVYGLMAIQKYVADRVSIPVGPLSIISHSISIDPQGGGLERAKAIAKTQADVSLRLDPCGDFVVTMDKSTREIVVQHYYAGRMLTEYRARRAEDLEKMLVRDLALSEIAHALYLGREIARQELQLKKME